MGWKLGRVTDAMQSIELIYINKILLKTLTLRKRGTGFDAWRYFVECEAGCNLLLRWYTPQPDGTIQRGGDEQFAIRRKEQAAQV